MKNLYFLLLLLPANLLSQSFTSKQCTAIVDEGVLIYKLETANTFVSELMAEHFPSAPISGTLCYQNKKEITGIVWVEVGTKIIVSYTYHFPDPLLKENAQVENVERNATSTELQLIKAYQVTNQLLFHDDFFSAYNNINFTMDFLPTENQTRVILLSNTSIASTIIVGNDYEVSIGLNGEVLKKIKLHALNIMMDPDAIIDSGKKTVTLKAADGDADEMTSSLIATLLLNRSKFTWNEFDYASKKYLSTFNIDTQQLNITDVKQ